MLLIRDWRKYLLDDVIEGDLDNIIQKEKEDIDEVEEPSSMSSEQTHGGNEATKDIPSSTNPATEGQQQQDLNQSNQQDQTSTLQSSNNTQQNNDGQPQSLSSDNENNENNENKGNKGNKGNNDMVFNENGEGETDDGNNDGDNGVDENSDVDSNNEENQNNNNSSKEDINNNQENNDNNSDDCELGHDEYVNEEDENEEDDYEYNQDEINHRSYYRDEKFYYKRRLQNAFATCIQKVAEDLEGYDVDGDDLWDINAIMMRKFNNRPLLSCQKSLERTRIILALDFSGSCKDYSEFFHELALIAEKFGDVEVFDASNGFDMSNTENNYCITDNKFYNYKYFKNRTIIFFGDFDGGASLVELSQLAKIYWFSCESRYDDLDDHSWCGNYTLNDFKGKYFECYDEKDFIKLIKKIK